MAAISAAAGARAPRSPAGRPALPASAAALHVTHVARTVGQARQPGQAGRVLQAARQLVNAEPAVLQQPQQQAGVDGAGPGRHHKALQRREPHCGVDAGDALHGGERRPGAQVAGHHAKPGPAEQLRASGRGVLVREPVKAVPPQAEALGPFAGQGVGWLRPRRHAGMKRRVEAGNGGQPGQRGLRGLDPGQGPRLVQRRQVGQVRDSRDHRLIDDRGADEPAAPMHHPVAGRVKAGLGTQELAEVGVVGAAVPGVDVQRRDGLVRRAEHAELEAARPGVDDEDAGHA